MTVNRRLAVGYLLASVGAALFSTKAIFIKLAYQERPDAALMLAQRMIISLPVFVAIGLYAWRQQVKSGKPAPALKAVLGAAAAGFIGYYIAMILDFEGLVRISAQLERLVLFTYPIFVMLLGAAFFGGRITRHGLTGAAISYAGLAFVFRADAGSEGPGLVTGVMLVTGSAIVFAFYQLFAKGYIVALGSVMFTAIALTAASAACIGHYGVVSGGFDVSASSRQWWLAAATGLVATVIPNFLSNAGMARIGPQSFGMIATLGPVLTIYFAVLFLGEAFGLSQAIGTALVIAGVGYYTWAEFKLTAAVE